MDFCRLGQQAFGAEDVLGLVAVLEQLIQDFIRYVFSWMCFPFFVFTSQSIYTVYLTDSPGIADGHGSDLHGQTRGELAGAARHPGPRQAEGR